MNPTFKTTRNTLNYNWTVEEFFLFKLVAVALSGKKIHCSIAVN
jgi:hypothetical protein